MCLVTLVLMISLQFLLHILHCQPLANCSKVISLKIMKFSEGSKGLISGSTSSLNYHMLKSIYCLNVACSTFLFFKQLDPCINAEVLQFYTRKDHCGPLWKPISRTREKISRRQINCLKAHLILILKEVCSKFKSSSSPAVIIILVVLNALSLKIKLVRVADS